MLLDYLLVFDTCVTTGGRVAQTAHAVAVCTRRSRQASARERATTAVPLATGGYARYRIPLFRLSGMFF